jgi:hypothetical protein
MLEMEFLKAITTSFSAYNAHGARSNKKLLPIHKWLAEVVGEKLGPAYSVRSLGMGGECVVAGKYYPKAVDVAILKKEKIITVISFKFVTSNYKQNANNYFEGLLGETANIRRVNVGFAHFLVLRSRTPYFNKNKGNLRGTQTKTEMLNENDIQKYIKLFNDADFPHKPEVLGIAIVDFDARGNSFFADLRKLKLSPKTRMMVMGPFFIDSFMEKVVALCKLKS